MVEKMNITNKQLDELSIDQKKILFEAMQPIELGVNPTAGLTIGFLFRMIDGTRPLVWEDQDNWHIVAKVSGVTVSSFGKELIDLLWDIFKLKYQPSGGIL